MTLDKVRPATVQPMGPVYLSRRLTVVSENPRPRIALRWLAVAALLALLIGLLLAAAVLIRGAGALASVPPREPRPTSSGLAFSREDAMPRAGESPALLVGTHAAPMNRCVTPTRPTVTGLQAKAPPAPPQGSRMGGSLLLVAESVAAAACEPFPYVCTFPVVRCECVPFNLGRASLGRVRLATAEGKAP